MRASEFSCEREHACTQVPEGADVCACLRACLRASKRIRGQARAASLLACESANVVQVHARVLARLRGFLCACVHLHARRFRVAELLQAAGWRRA
jgi:hypothetical protein